MLHRTILLMYRWWGESHVFNILGSTSKLKVILDGNWAIPKQYHHYKKEKLVKIGKKKVPIGPFLAHPAGGQETIFYLKMA